MIRRLRVKFICINMAIVTVMMLAILGMLLHFTRNDLEQQSIRVMQSVMEDRAYPSRPGEFPRQAKLPYFYVSVNTMGELSASFGGYYDLTNTEAIQQIITLALNSDDQTGILKDYSLRFQKRTTPFGQTIMPENRKAVLLDTSENYRHVEVNDNLRFIVEVFSKLECEVMNDWFRSDEPTNLARWTDDLVSLVPDRLYRALEIPATDR